MRGGKQGKMQLSSTWMALYSVLWTVINTLTDPKVWNSKIADNAKEGMAPEQPLKWHFV